MNDALISVIRTVVPATIASVLTWLAAKIGYDGTLPDLGPFAVVAVLFVYYGVVRWIEIRVPWFGFLLGYPKQPVYREPKNARRN